VLQRSRHGRRNRPGPTQAARTDARSLSGRGAGGAAPGRSGACRVHSRARCSRMGHMATPLSSQPVAGSITLQATSDSRFFNRELSWLEFNARVLHEAFDERNPLLERLRFLAIFSTNLDEFYMVRVAGLRRRLAGGVLQASADGMTPRAQLDAINTRVAA